MMSRQFQITTAPLWTLAGFGLLVASFAFTGWMLGNAIVAADHLLDIATDFLHSDTEIFQPGTHNVFAS